MDEFEEQKMKKIRPIIRKCFHRLINKNVIGKKPEIFRDKLKNKVIIDISRIFETKKEEKKKKNHNGRIKKNIIIRAIRTLFETEKEEERKKKKEHDERLIKNGIIKEEDYYYKPQIVNNFWNNNYIKYESNVDKNRNLSLDEYLNKIETYLRNIIIHLQDFDTRKI